MRIKELTLEERPRERLLRNGPEALSSGELLAVLLRTGTQGESALDLAQRLLSLAGGSLVRLSRMPPSRYREVRGLGGAKSAPLLAAFELGRRFMEEEMDIDKVTIVSPAQVYRLMVPALKGLATEECWALYLNSANYVVAKERISAGGVSATIIDVKVVVAKALEVKASAVIMIHNHPSGNPRPGQEDLRQTASLRQALLQFNISLIDHVVVCDDCYYSFADETVGHA